MKKLLFVSAIALFAFTSASAQEKSSESSIQGFKVGAGLSVGFPMGGTLQKNPSYLGLTSPNSYTVGVGVDLLAQYGITDNIAITGDLGFTSLMVNKAYKRAETDANYIGTKKSLSLIPIRVGLRYYPTSQIYIGAKAGVAIGTNAGYKLEYDAVLDDYVAKTKSETLMAYSFGVGYMLSSKLDVSINYDGYSKKTTIPGYDLGGGLMFPATKVKNTLGVVGVRLGYTFGN